ncbi:hypothetical protein I601_3953 [Nocardioides dokdonensis FR1436]|uniref:Uncharacterized protein n=1 Tax=Nocardioides dokdonensis FR1436 TaxID=1300347 RepID=A0A1A9GRP9_9ACTN|nr:hypothetical protein [Nocardioides dokdonensis]ANH40350.1 hypothetical protein I601_3953 [Nocardioides dokdonensis FR1436]
MTPSPSPPPSRDGHDHLSRAEIGKDAAQSAIEATATTVGEVATIVTSAIKDVASALGGLATDVFEIRQAAQRAARGDDDV